MDDNGGVVFSDPKQPGKLVSYIFLQLETAQQIATNLNNSSNASVAVRDIPLGKIWSRLSKPGSNQTSTDPNTIELRLLAVN